MVDRMQYPESDPPSATMSKVTSPPGGETNFNHATQ
jgi:hypothetical protein